MCSISGMVSTPSGSFGCGRSPGRSRRARPGAAAPTAFEPPGAQGRRSRRRRPDRPGPGGDSDHDRARCLSTPRPPDVTSGRHAGGDPEKPADPECFEQSLPSRSDLFPTRTLAFDRTARRTVNLVIRSHGAPSIAQGRTPHEVQDELCRARAWAASDRRCPNPRFPSRTGDAAAHVRRPRAPTPKDTPMAINLDELRARPLDPEIDDEIDRFEAAIDEYLAGDLAEDVFRVMRLNQGIYGQRQGGTNQMVRVKIPYGRVEPEQLEMLGSIAETLLARLGSPHHPPERAVPLRPAARHPRGAPPARARSGSPAARRAATPCATSPAATSPARARTRCSTSRRGPRPSPTCSSATRSRSGSPASSRSTSAAAPPTAARRCSTTSASSR